MTDTTPTATKAAEFLNKNWQGIAGALVAACIAWGGIAGYHVWTEKKEQEAQELLFTLQKKLEDKQSEILRAEEEKDGKKNAKKEAGKEPEKTPEALSRNYGEIINEFKGFISSYNNRVAGAMAAIELAGLAASHKDWKLADEALALVESKLDPKNLFYGLVHGQRGTVLSELGNHEEAIAHFDRILAVEDLKYAHPEALLRKAASHIELKQWDQAEAALAKIESEAAMSQAGMTAKGLKRLLNLKKGEG